MVAVAHYIDDTDLALDTRRPRRRRKLVPAVLQAVTVASFARFRQRFRQAAIALLNIC
jgi:hypothetical protein